jgi:hypothetical protein
MGGNIERSMKGIPGTSAGLFSDFCFSCKGANLLKLAIAFTE